MTEGNLSVGRWMGSVPSMRRQSLHHSLIERFAEGSRPDPGDGLERVTKEGASPQVKRFLKMVAVRKEQMLEKILIDEA